MIPHCKWVSPFGAALLCLNSMGSLAPLPAQPAKLFHLTGPAGSRNSTSIAVNTTPDTMPPTVVSAFGGLAPTCIQIHFSEPVTEVTATNVANYAVAPRVGGGDLAILRAELRNETNVILTTSLRQDDRYMLTVRDVSDRASTGNLLSPNPTVRELPVEILLADVDALGPWAYNDTGADLDTAWRRTWFLPGTDWQTGWPLFYGHVGTPGALELPQNTALGLTNDLADTPGRVITYYFRARLKLTAEQLSYRPLKLQYIVDDGAVFYVNGTEVLRTGMPSGVVSHQTLATRTTGTDQLWEEPVVIDSTAFYRGTNVVAVEVHQAAETNPDVAFALRLVGTFLCCPGPPFLAEISVDSQGNVILRHSGDQQGYPVYVQEATSLAPEPADTVWTTRPGGPHGSPYFAGPAAGTRFFRISTYP